MKISFKTTSILRTTSVVLTLALATSSATAAAGIAEDQEVFDRLFYTAIANEIRENCDTISARELRATLYVLGILTYAKSQGYSKTEIETYRTDPDQLERLKSVGYAYLDEQGVDRAAGTGYCDLGQAEMAKNSQIGRLLK